MKNLWGFFVTVFCAGVLICMTEPTNQECIDAIKSTSGMGALAGVAINSYTVSIEDHFFYKKIYSTIDGQCLGTGFCTHVFVSE